MRVRGGRGSIRKRRRADGSTSYVALYRAAGTQHAKSFPRQRDAEQYLVEMVGRVHAGSHVVARPTPMAGVFDRWATSVLEPRLADGSLKPSTGKSYRSMLKEHLRPAFAALRSDQFDLAAVEAWHATLAARIAAGTLTAKTSRNLKNLAHAIATWARHPQRRYLVVDPFDGLPKVRLPRAKKRAHFEPAQVFELFRVAAESPPDDTIIRTALFSGVRRGELFALKWSDLETGEHGEGGRLHVRRSIYQGALTTPKTEDSTRVLDVPPRVLDDLAVYKVMHPPIGEGFIFRQATGQPLDPDRWHRQHLVPILKRAGLHLRGTGLHALRHTYVSLLLAQGEDIRFIADQVGHSSTQLTRDIYAHVLRSSRTEAMRRLDQFGLVPPSE